MKRVFSNKQDAGDVRERVSCIFFCNYAENFEAFHQEQGSVYFYTLKTAPHEQVSHMFCIKTKSWNSGLTIDRLRGETSVLHQEQGSVYFYTLKTAPHEQFSHMFCIKTKS